jgi:hypothetical protein
MSSVRRAKLLTAVALVMAAGGDIDQAEATGWAITDPARRARALMAVAETVADSGDIERAEAVASSIVGSVWRAQALTTLALKAEPKRARSIIVQALSAGDWTTIMGALAQIDSSLFANIADDYIRAESLG